MAVVTAAAIAAGAALAGGYMQSQSAKGMSTDQRHFSREMFDKQTSLANRAHQRQVADLKAAGLNLIFFAQSGGAAVPGVTGYSTPQVPNILGDAASAGVSAYQAANSAQVQQAQTQQIQASEQLVLQQVQNHKATERLTNQQTKNLSQQLTLIKTDILYRAQQIVETQARTRNLSAEAQQKELANVYNQLAADWYESNAPAVIAKELGIHGPASVKMVKDVGKSVLSSVKKLWRH